MGYPVQILYEVSWKVPGLGQKKKYWLNLLHFVYHLFQNSLLENVYRVLIVFSTFQEQRGRHFLQCCQVPLAIPFGCQLLFQTSSLQSNFQFGEQGNHRGLSPVSRVDGES